MTPVRGTTLYLDCEVRERLKDYARRHRVSMSGAANLLLITSLGITSLGIEPTPGGQRG